MVIAGPALYVRNRAEWSILAYLRGMIMPANLRKTITIRRSTRTALTLTLALASLIAVSVPSRARDGGQIAADVIDAIGRAVAPHKDSPPAAAQAAPQPKIKYVPVPYYVRSPSHAPRDCWYEGRSVFDGEDYVHSKVKVCR